MRISGLLYSNDRRFLFIHVPKTAGGSLKRALLDRCEDALSPELAMKIAQRAVSGRFATSSKRTAMACIRFSPLRYFVTSAEHPTAALTLMLHPAYRSFRKFAFVRNPFDRIVSAFEYSRQQIGYEGSFSQFVGNCNVYLQPQVNFVFFYRKQLVDWIGRFERIDEDVQYLSDWLGLPKLVLSHRNRTERAPYRDYLTPSVKQRIVEAYSSDFAAFDYACD